MARADRHPERPARANQRASGLLTGASGPSKVEAEAARCATIRPIAAGQAIGLTAMAGCRPEIPGAPDAGVSAIALEREDQ